MTASLDEPQVGIRFVQIGVVHRVVSLTECVENAALSVDVFVRLRFVDVCAVLYVISVMAMQVCFRVVLYILSELSQIRLVPKVNQNTNTVLWFCEAAMA